MRDADKNLIVQTTRTDDFAGPTTASRLFFNANVLDLVVRLMADESFSELLLA